ncbi:lymphocyte antigen 6E [Pogona vitticeps]
MMKALTVMLLASALCLERASSLQCYKCENVKSHADCKLIRCSDLDRHCVSFYHERAGEATSINKYCAPSCPNFNTEVKGSSKISSTCCETDGCNSGGPSTVKTSYSLMALATLASFFYALRTGL